MDVRKWLVGMVVLGVCLATGSAFAAYTNQTISDEWGTGTGWYRTDSIADPIAEDQEVETNCIANQSWDLEAFMFDGIDNAAMVGGWNFLGMDNWQSGDIFIDINGDALYGAAAVPVSPGSGNGNTPVANVFNYDYVMDIHWENASGGVVSYDVISILSTSTVTLTEAYYNQNEASNPYRYLSGGIDTGIDGQITLGTWNNSQTNFLGTGHNSASWDMSWLLPMLPGYDPLAEEWSMQDDAYLHFTQRCGNDNLMGRLEEGWEPTPPPVPEPATLVLMGLSLMGLAASRKAVRHL